MTLLVRSSAAAKACLHRGPLTYQRRSIATKEVLSRKEGNISSVFRSLSATDDEPLPARFADVKRDLLQNRSALEASWTRLLHSLQTETQTIKKLGSASIPEIQFRDIDNPPKEFNEALRRTGVAVVRQVVPEAEARAYKEDAEAYIAANPSTKAFPEHDPQVFELYWSKPQVKARGHPNMLKMQKFLMSYYDTSGDLNAPCSTQQPLSYADRLRIRQPGDSGFALGPHVDGGSVERWEKNGYGKGHVYDKIFEGAWEDFNPWEVTTRLNAVSDLYNGAGACSMFRMYQGWLGLSHTGPWEGTLLVNPLLTLATSYYLLRPFFVPRKAPTMNPDGSYQSEFLEPSNWKLEHDSISSALQGAWPGHGQELNHELHPHLNLADTMVHVPRIAPGDYVAWHCDTIHAVDKTHAGKGDSSVLYIPVCPTTKSNLDYMRQQRDYFLQGVPAPDFPGGVGESSHVGRATEEWARANLDKDGLRAAGLESFDETQAKNEGEAYALAYGNSVLKQ